MTHTSIFTVLLELFAGAGATIIIAMLIIGWLKGIYWETHSPGKRRLNRL